MTSGICKWDDVHWHLALALKAQRLNWPCARTLNISLTNKINKTFNKTWLLGEFALVLILCVIGLSE